MTTGLAICYSVDVSTNPIVSIRRNMKKIVASTITALLLLILLANTSFAAPAVEKQLLLKGSLDTTETQEGLPPFIEVNLTGHGNATQLGLFTYQLHADLDLRVLHSQASATLIAANGDRIFGEGEGQGTFTGTPGKVSIVETFDITGGTGRFEGATGTFVVKRLVNRPTLTSTGTIEGTILLP
jgi:hypothetical protein